MSSCAEGLARWQQSFPMWKQGELSPECGPYCAFSLARYFRTANAWDDDWDFPLAQAPRPQRRKPGEFDKGTPPQLLLALLKDLGLEPKKPPKRVVNAENALEWLLQEGLGLVLVRWNLGAPDLGVFPVDETYVPKLGHYVVVLEVTQDAMVIVADPYPGVPRVYPVHRSVFEAAWGWKGAPRWGVRVRRATDAGGEFAGGASSGPRRISKARGRKA